MTHEVTIFKSIHQTDAPFHRDVHQILERIKDGNSKDIVEAIRKEKDKEKKQEIKKRLPAICFSGVFIKRNDTSLQQHSGLICLDFDGYATKKDLEAERKKLIEDKYTFACFISPSGNGLKVVVKIPANPEEHKDYFNSLRNHYNSIHFDVTSKNLSRVCYESYDPKIYINEKAQIWIDINEKEYTEIQSKDLYKSIPITDENKIVDILVKWWQKKHPMVEGQRNHNCYVLASAFNDYGINKYLAEYVLSTYRSESFTESEIKTTIDSAYSNTANFGTKFYVDEEKIKKVKNKLKKGDTKEQVVSFLKDLDIEDDKAESIVEEIQTSDDSVSFWTKTEKGVIKVIPFLLKKFLETNGFYKYEPDGTNSFVFVRLQNNLLDHTSEADIKDFVLTYLMDNDLFDIYNYFASATKFFKEDFLNLLSSVNLHFVKDTRSSSYLYYRNCAVKVSYDKVETIDYIDLGGYVWKDHVIDRDFNFCDDHNCDYRTFISNICNKQTDRIQSMESTIGFMLHGFKNLSFCPAVILNDEVISDNPEGGTGKGIFMSALSYMKKLVVIDGKSFFFEKSFPYQTVSTDTQIICFDDVRKNFPFERLFSVVTEGLTLEKKNKDAIKIPFDKSPKIAITTNYAIGGSGNSFERRKWELELNQHYTKNYTPLHEFGKMMFGDWTEDEWCSFDNYMISCLQVYLNKGLVKSEFVNLKIRKLSAETCHEFVEWCGLINGSQPNPLLEVNKTIYMNEIYFNFIEEYPDFAPKAKMTISRTKFYKWIESYAKYSEGVAPEMGKDRNGKYVRIRRKHELEKQLEF